MQKAADLADWSELIVLEKILTFYLSCVSDKLSDPLSDSQGKCLVTNLAFVIFLSSMSELMFS